MRIAVVYHFFASYRAPINEELKASADDYVFVGDDVNRMMPGLPVWIPEDPKIFVKARCWIMGPLMLQSRIISLALRRDLDTIIYLGNYQWPCTWLSSMLARMMGKTVLFWTHGWRRKERGLKGAIRRCFYRIGHGILLYGNKARRIGIESGFPAERLYVIFNSLDYKKQLRVRESITTDVVMSTRRELFPDSNAPIAICSARLNKYKRLDRLIEAAARMNAEGRPLNLLIIGDGSERSSLIEFAKKMQVKAVFWGECFDEEIVGRLTASSDVTVVPGALGLTGVQSLAYGVPVVTAKDVELHGPEFEVVVDGTTGAVYEDGDMDSMVGAIARMTSVSSEEKEAIRDACYRVVDTYYNPNFQAKIIARAVRLEDAEEHLLTDLFS